MITVIKESHLMMATYSDDEMGFEKHVENIQTGRSITLLSGDLGIKTEILCNSLMTYTHSQFDEINGVSITTNEILFDELSKML